MKMNRIYVILLILLVAAFHGYAQNNEESKRYVPVGNDSVVIINFKANSDMFFATYRNNGNELNRLLNITKEHGDAIRNGNVFVFVNGYRYVATNPVPDPDMARIRSNRVKSELIVRRGLEEANYITANHNALFNNMNNVVVVSLGSPLATESIIPEIPKPEVNLQELPEPPTAEEELVAANPPEETTIPVVTEPEPAVAVMPQTPPIRSTDKDPAWFSEHTNLLLWAILTPNTGVEWRLGREMNWGLSVSGAFANWQWRHRSRRYSMWMIGPELRHYLSDRWFVGLHSYVGELNIKLSNTGRRGVFFGGGIVGGYRLPLSKRFDMDFTLGLGYTRYNKDNYIREDGRDVVICRNAYKNIIGPTQVGVILRYKIIR